jgi:hypothetical protein
MLYESASNFQKKKKLYKSKLKRKFLAI